MNWSIRTRSNVLLLMGVSVSFAWLLRVALTDVEPSLATIYVLFPAAVMLVVGGFVLGALAEVREELVAGSPVMEPRDVSKPSQQGIGGSRKPRG